MKTKLAVIVLLIVCFSCGTDNKPVSGPEKNVGYNEPSKDLNQVELWKKFSGTWKGEIAKDTFIVYEERPYGTGMENKISIVTKDTVLQEGIGLFGYDRESDKIIEATLLDGADIVCNAFWFISENMCEGIPFKNIADPVNSDMKWKIEFKSRDMWAVETLVDGKTVATNSLYRIK